MRVDLTERQQVGAIMLMAGLAIFLIWFFLLMPLNRRRQRLEGEIRDMTTQLAHNNYLLGEEPLRKRRIQAQNRHEQYVAQLKETLALLSMPDKEKITNSAGRIDYKVELFGVRRRLRQKANDLGIRLPPDLGIEDSVSSTEDARKLMLQLRAVEETVDLALDLKIRMIRNIEPMTPILHSVANTGIEFLEEYPVRVDFFASATNLYAFFDAVQQTNHVFVLKNLRMEKASPRQPDLVDVRAVLSALVFAEYTNELVVASTEPKVSTPLRGY